MYSIKEKFTEKLGRLFADSPNNSAASFAADSSFEDHQVRSYSKGGKSTSFFSFIIPLGSSDGSKSEQLQHDLRSSRSLPCRRMDNYEECISCCSGSESKQESPVSESKQSSPSSSGDSVIFAEANELLSQTKLLTNLTEESTFITPELYEFLQSSIPNIVKGCQWILLYSTLKHGISLRTLLRKSADLSGPCLLIVGDLQGAVFGGMLECPLKPTPKRKYQGTNQTFVFTTIYGEPRLFRPTGANRYYYMCLNDLLALGGGGSYALCLDGDLLNGTSGPCETFGNLCLAHNPEFELKNVELWAFSHVSHYLS